MPVLETTGNGIRDKNIISRCSRSLPVKKIWGTDGCCFADRAAGYKTVKNPAARDGMKENKKPAVAGGPLCFLGLCRMRSWWDEEDRTNCVIILYYY